VPAWPKQIRPKAMNAQIAEVILAVIARQAIIFEFARNVKLALA